MIKTIYPSKDATIYSTSGSINTGIDEILELQKVISGSGGPLDKSRILIQFDTSTISASLSSLGIHTGSDSGSLKWNLKLFVGQEKDVPVDYSVAAHYLTEDWEMGVGRKTNNPLTKEGCSWTYRDGEDAGTTWTTEGGTYSTTYASSQSISNVEGDLNIDVTDIVENVWHNGTATNYGFLIMRSGSQETDSNEYGIVHYFSRETNTIYPPRLEAIYDNTPTRDITSMTTASAEDDITITALMQEEYKQNSETRIELIVEPKYPGRSQSDTVGTSAIYALPSNTTYSIIDDTTGESVIDYNTTGTVIACNNKHYIDINLAGLFPERYYRLQIKVSDLLFTNSVQYFDIPTLFKVVR